jgi:hypothetical protein
MPQKLAGKLLDREAAPQRGSVPSRLKFKTWAALSVAANQMDPVTTKEPL